MEQIVDAILNRWRDSQAYVSARTEGGDAAWVTIPGSVAVYFDHSLRLITVQCDGEPCGEPMPFDTPASEVVKTIENAFSHAGDCCNDDVVTTIKRAVS